MPRRRKRLDPASFNLPVERLHRGLSSDRGVDRVREVLQAAGPAPRATVQISAERPCILGGTDEVIALLKVSFDDWSSVAVHALYDGDRVEAGETVMTIE